MDHGNAQSTFVEIAFGINTLFTTYKGFRDQLKHELEKRVKESEAVINSIEPNPQMNGPRLGWIKSLVSGIASSHIMWQERSIPIAVAVSLAGAVGCILVAYFDWFEILGEKNWILIVPFPLYVCASILNYLVFKARVSWKLNRFAGYVKEFEPPPPPVPPSPTGSNSPIPPE